ncbi:hypothetical protein ACNPQK_18215 [Acinetobacter guillouiae]|uniref:hypothetical protein n=1 Tax=Acinetobacter guillouiae TaxID=106649 RepID=UPI003AF43A48
MIADIFSKTFGGLRKDYFIRNLIIGIVAAVLAWLMIDTLEARATTPKPFWNLVIIKGFFIFNGLLYPYAKYLYDYIWEVITGDAVYVYSINIITIWFKLIARLMCFFFAWVLAPVGLLILYFKNS